MNYKVKFNIPSLTGLEERHIIKAMQSGEISGDCDYGNKCQRWFEDETGCPKVLLTPSCTAALEMAAILLDIQPGDEVIMPSYTFVSTANAFVLRGAKIVFVDIRPDTMNIDEKLIEAAITSKTKAIVPVHYGGLCNDMDRLNKIASRYNIPIIQDAAHSIGTTYKGKHLAELSDYVMYSFQAIKHFTTGDGGMLIIKNKDLVDKAERIRWFGIDRKSKQAGIWENDITEVGYKYQMTDIAAAMGIASLSEFDEQFRLRKELYETYEAELTNCERLKVVGGGFSDREHAAWLFTILVENKDYLQKKCNSYDKNKEVSNQCDLCNRLMLLHCYNK